MKNKITVLNSLFLSGSISFSEYKQKAEKLLRSLDWQKRIQYDNMLYM